MKLASPKYSPADFSAGQVHEMLVTLGKFGFSPEMAAAVANVKTNKAVAVVGLFADGQQLSLASWQKFYQDYFGLEKDFSGLVIPKHQPGFDRLLVIAEGMSPDILFAKCQELFSSWRYTENLDVVESVRKTDHDYAVWIRDRAAADEENSNKSAADLEQEGISGITLEERLVYELKYFEETCGKHLDIQSITLCSGSRSSDGYVPYARWGNDGFDVIWFYLRDAGPCLRARSVVS